MQNKELTKILLLSKTYRKPIRDISETNMPDQRPIRDQHHRPMGDQHARLETDMPDRRPIGD